MDCGLRQRDLLRFMYHYCDGGLREALKGDVQLWQEVARVATRLYIKEHGRSPPDIAGEGVRS